MIKKVENLLREYKNNLAESKMLTYRLSLQAVQYDRDNVQTSNKSDLSDIVVAREKKLEQIRRDINDTEALVSILGEKEKIVIEGFYFEKKTLPQITVDIDYTSSRGTFNVKDRALMKMAELYEKMESMEI